MISEKKRTMTKSVYKYAAEAGVPMGLYLTCMGMSMLLAPVQPGLAVVYLGLLLGFPFAIARAMNWMRSHEPSYGRTQDMWLMGMYAVIFGVLIRSLVLMVFLMWIEPGYVHRIAVAGLEAMRDPAYAADYASTAYVLERAVQSHMLPSPTELVLAMGWCTCGLGSVLSGLVALFLVHRRRSRLGL